TSSRPVTSTGNGARVPVDPSPVNPPPQHRTVPSSRRAQKRPYSVWTSTARGAVWGGGAHPATSTTAAASAPTSVHLDLIAPLPATPAPSFGHVARSGNQF